MAEPGSLESEGTSFLGEEGDSVSVQLTVSFSWTLRTQEGCLLQEGAWELPCSSHLCTRGGAHRRPNTHTDKSTHGSPWFQGLVSYRPASPTEIGCQPATQFKIFWHTC